MRDLSIDDLDFATIHVYPSNWGIPANQYQWVNENYIGDRSSLAAASGKPIVFEVILKMRGKVCVGRDGRVGGNRGRDGSAV